MREQFLKRLEEVVNKEEILDFSREVSNLIRDYKSILSDEKYLGKSEEEEITEEEQEKIRNNNLLDEKINQLITVFIEKKNKAKDKLEEELKKNLLAKKDILKEFKSLVETEENIGQAFAKRKEIQERWKEIGQIASDKFEEIQREYSLLSDRFNYNINLYKAIKDHDLKKNFSLKNQVIFQLNNLLSEKSIKKVQDELNILMGQWDEIGPTFQEEWEKLKESYWNLVNEIRAKINTFYKEQKETLAKNLELKEELINKANEVAKGEFKTVKEWGESTDKLKELQEEWKRIGGVIREKNEEIWEKFRGVFDQYFDRKKAYFKDLRAESSENIKRKKEIIAKAEELKMSDLWKETTRDIINLQKQWKNIGHAGKSEQKLWQDFRSACDYFFNNKKEYFENRDEIENKNLHEKKSLIEEIKKFTPSDDSNETITKLKNFAAKFNQIGNVPFKAKDSIYKAFKEALDEHYSKLKIDKQEREKMFFQSKINSLLDKSDAGRAIKEESNRLKRRLSKISAEITQYENNLGFFGSSSGADALIADVKKKINRAKGEMDSIKQKLKLLRENENKKN